MNNGRFGKFIENPSISTKLQLIDVPISFFIIIIFKRLNWWKTNKDTLLVLFRTGLDIQINLRLLGTKKYNTKLFWNCFRLYR